jgi:hypothetical protein
MTDISSYMNAFGKSFQDALMDWPLWIGFAAMGYVTDMAEDAFRRQAPIVQYLVRGASTTVNMEYYAGAKGLL